MQNGDGLMPLLAAKQRHSLKHLLAEASFFDREEARTLLLADLPPALVDGLARSATTAIDLAAIVEGCNNWDPPDADTPHPIRLLLASALEYTAGSHTAVELDK